MYKTTHTDLASQFAQELSISINIADDTKYLVDNSNFNYVDGEEGDYGFNLYYLNEKLICKEVNYGGDNQEYLFTETGKEYLFNKILQELNKRKNNFVGFQE